MTAGRIVAAAALLASAWVRAEGSEPAALSATASSPVPEDVEATSDEGAAASALSARGNYNLGLERLAQGDATGAAEAFLTARDNAGPDPQLRYRVAFNLGLALATQADAKTAAAGAAEDEVDVEAALDLLRQSAAWFNDAVRLAPAADDDARVNLELVSRRILQLVDQLKEGDELTSRLDRLIDDQRGARDQVRQLLATVTERHAGADPLGFGADFDNIASRQRMLMAEVGDAIDLATEERLFIEQTPPEQRAPEQQSRAHQLANVTDYLERARQSLGDARRRLRRLQGERGHRRADAALAELKRAREQLRDPVTVLRAVSRDLGELIVHTMARAAFDDRSLRLEETPPPWLTAKHLAERQENAAARTGGVLGIFDGLLAAGASADAGAEAARARAAVAEASPVLEAGLAAMRDAVSALESGDAAMALPAQNTALKNLRDAIELFADLRGLIDLAYAGQQRAVDLLTPPAADQDEAEGELSAAQRVEALDEAVFVGQRRLGRLEQLLREEGEATAELDEQAKPATEQRLELAETLRAEAADGLERLAASVDGLAAGRADAKAARAVAEDTLATLEQLRRLFFSVAEHLRELLVEQAETHDRAATAQFESTVDKMDTLAAELGATADRQANHAGVGEQLAAALARQADAGAPPASGDPQHAAADAGAQLGEAAEEVRKATTRMTSAATMLADAAARANVMSPELEPALADQTAAMEHLENALRALAPPNQDSRSPSGDDQQQAEQEAGEERSEDDQERLSQRQAKRRLQAIRDREAERQNRRGDAAASRESVEKDW